MTNHEFNSLKVGQMLRYDFEDLGPVILVARQAFVTTNCHELTVLFTHRSGTDVGNTWPMWRTMLQYYEVIDG